MAEVLDLTDVRLGLYLRLDEFAANRSLRPCDTGKMGRTQKSGMLQSLLVQSVSSESFNRSFFSRASFGPHFILVGNNRTARKSGALTLAAERSAVTLVAALPHVRPGDHFVGVVVAGLQ
jgi:hypothetical protein